MPTETLPHERWLYHLAHVLHEQEGSPRAVQKTALARAQQVTRAERGCIVTFEADGGFKDVYLPDRHATAPDNELWQRLSELVRNSRRTVTIGDLSVDQPWPRRETPSARSLSGSALAVALQRENRLVGVLMLYHSHPLHFDAAAAQLLEIAARTIAVALDNTEQLQMLADSQALYRRLYKDASFPTIITTLAGDIIDANPKAYEMFGYDRKALLGLPMAALMRVDGVPLSNDNLRAAAANEELTLNATARASDGQTLSIRLLARGVRLDTADYLVWVAQDMSAQAEQETMRRDLSAMIYHDLRGPLHNINLGLTRVDRLLTDRSPAVSQLLELALGSTRQLTRMVNSLLDLEQLETGHAELNLQLVASADLITQAVEATRLLSEDTGHELQCDVAPHLPLLNVDADMMVRVFINLIENAIKYTPSGGTVQLEAAQNNGQVWIAVSDNGPGISPEVRQQVFDKYVRVRGDRSHSGIGLGLAFCRLAVQAHGGQIWVEDNAPQGARFIVTLPLPPDQTSG